jgi:hypothetical protein
VCCLIFLLLVTMEIKGSDFDLFSNVFLTN